VNSAIKLIGLDWGSTNVRAFAFDGEGNVLQRAHSTAGAMTLSSNAQFDAALVSLVGQWQSANHAIPMIACGMVGARGGWIEAGYCAVDSNAAALSAAMVSVQTSFNVALRVVPGIRTDAPDVMRGEETQIVGADINNGVIVMPGTHSKWSRVVDGKIKNFATFLTGEMNALLRNHSVIGKAINCAPSLARDDAIKRGIARSASSTNWLSDLFAFRARVVTAAVSEEDASSELSAWLIANEFAQARTMGFHDPLIHVLSSDTLMPWYASIGAALDIEIVQLDAEAATARGLWTIAQAAQAR
jgi:2-dehydro-3-deoxygalactonokinase